PRERVEPREDHLVWLAVNIAALAVAAALASIAGAGATAVSGARFERRRQREQRQWERHDRTDWYSGPLLAAASSLSSRLCNAVDTDQIAESTGGDGRSGSPQPGSHQVRFVRQSAWNSRPSTTNPPSSPRMPATHLHCANVALTGRREINFGRFVRPSPEWRHDRRSVSDDEYPNQIHASPVAACGPSRERTGRNDDHRHHATTRAGRADAHPGRPRRGVRRVRGDSELDLDADHAHRVGRGACP